MAYVPTGKRWCDSKASACPHCGGNPIVVKHAFNIKSEGRYHYVRGERKALLRELRAYYHCPCSGLVLPWQRPEYDKDNSVTKTAASVAHDKWERLVVNAKKGIRK